MTLIKSISGIRGTIGGSTTENLTPIDIAKFASAYATWLKEQSDCSKRLKVVIGRDARISGEMVSTIVEGTLLGCGIDVINIGLASTPTTEMAVTAHSADGGIIVTASHNPKQWNALKLLNSKGEFLSDADGKRILAIADSDSYIFPEVDSLGKVLEHSSYNQQHIEQVLALKLVDVEAIKARKFKVVVDAVNSVGGVIVPEMLRQLGAEVIELNCTPDGQFTHNPEPIPANLTQISEAVVAHHADLGIVVDPDVDRLALINEDGSMFGEEYTLVAAADYVLAHTVGNTVSNLSSSRALRDVTRGYGASYSAAAVGEV
ncbi:MAG: phosphoglucosamine mutase, partial [Rikenellaceae bacterium]|nr:phosphoglucosamine mutase [Rikenellaceae bacterium]